jgi:hypothetical protein
MGRTKKYQTREDAITIQKTQVKNAQIRYKETRTCFRKNASTEQKGLIKLLNHTILTKDDAVLLLDTAKNFKNSKLITDILKEMAPPEPLPASAAADTPTASAPAPSTTTTTSGSESSSSSETSDPYVKENPPSIDIPQKEPVTPNQDK